MPDGSNKWLKTLVKIGVVISAAAVGFFVRGCSPFQRPVTITSLSPSDDLRVSLVELPSGIDRNFEVQIENIESGKIQTIFRSPDEGRPVGSEKIVWATDESHFLLLGRHFSVTEAGKLSNGEQAYLLMDVQSGQLWCNASQQSEYPEFGIAELKAVHWQGWSLADR